MNRRAPALAWCVALSGCLGGDADRGRAAFSTHCTVCHQSDGSGGIDVDGTASADLRTRVPELADEYVLVVLHDGKGTMPGQFGGDDAQAVDVLAYLRETFEPAE